MNKSFRPTLAGLLLFFSLAALPLKAQIPHLVFHAELSGDEAIPAVNTDGKGLVSFLFTPDRSKVSVSGMLVNIEGAITSATVRLGITGETGAEVFDLLPYIHGRHILGQVDVPPVLLQNLLLNSVYVDVRTTTHPNGAIRGQFTCEVDLDFKGLLTGAQVNPPTNSNAIAFGGFHFPLGSLDLVYAFTVRGLSSAITSVDLYEGLPGQSTVAPIHMPGMAAGLIQGLIAMDTIDPEFLRKAVEGKYYVLIKTVNFPQGEIQGQLLHIGYFASLAPINGVQQVPPPIPPTNGFGFSQTTPNGDLTELTTTIFVNNVAPTSVKIHIGDPGQTGPELVDMGISNTPGFYTKTYPITEAQLTDFAQGRMYVNVTTAAFPNGIIRGVMKNTLRKAYAFDLCGIQMVPPTNSDALGVAIASVDQANCYLNYKVIADGLASVPVDGYYAQGNVGANGIAFHALPNTAPIMPGSHEIMAALGPIIENSGTYVQIATMGYPNGEIRGQVRRGFACPEIVLDNDNLLDQISTVAVSPVPFADFLNVELESPSTFEGRLVVHDLMGVRSLVQPVQVVTGAQTFQVQTTHLPAGNYSISLEIPSENDAVLLKKVVKVK